MARRSGCSAVELSALRQAELEPMLDSLGELCLDEFSYVSIHAPSQWQEGWEGRAAELLHNAAIRDWTIVVHPNVLINDAMWRQFGNRLCIENMDKRKPMGRSARELRPFFERFPEATLCLDFGHARQVDPTMTEATLILREFGSRLRQVHLSDVSTASRHNPLSFLSIRAIRDLADMIPEDVPIILETPVTESGLAAEIEKAREALPLSQAA